MKLPQEIEASYIIPLVRKGLVEELAKHKLPQKRIAELLGLTDAAVSQYIKSKRGTRLKTKFDDEVKEMIKKSAKDIADAKSKPSKEIQKICTFIKKKGVLCRIHKTIEKIECSCRTCECDK